MSCNKNTKTMDYEDANENERNLDLSGLVNFGSNYIQPSEQPRELDICFKSIQINSNRANVGDIKMSSQLRLQCPSRQTKKPLNSSAVSKMIIRKPIELKVDEGERVSVKEFIPTLVNGKTTGTGFFTLPEVWSTFMS